MNLFLPVQAQVDDYSSPTIPFDPFQPQPTSGPSPVFSGPTISLESQTVEINPGERTRIRVIIDTDGQEIASYVFQITYNSNVVRVVDSNGNEPGIQIDFFDTFFEASVNEVNQQTGIISLIAQNPVGTSSITNRVVAEIDVEGTAGGFTEFAFDEANSNLLTVSSVNILQTLNNTSLTIQGDAINPTTAPQPTTPPNTTGQATINPSLLPTQIDVTKTPDTNFTGDISGPLTILLGVLMVTLGAYVYKLRNETGAKKVR